MAQTQDELELSMAGNADMQPVQEQDQDQDKQMTEQFIEEMAAAFKQMAEYIPKLHDKIREQDYEGVLQDIFSAALNYDDFARRMFIKVALNSMDTSILDDYLADIIGKEPYQVMQESEFRKAIRKLVQVWFNKVDLKLSFPPEHDAIVERRRQFTRLLNSMSAIPYKVDDETGVVNVYPDDQLMRNVVDIIDSGNRYYKFKVFDAGFNGFLTELKSLHKKHCEDKLHAHVDTFLSTEHGKDHLIKLLAVRHQRQGARVDHAVYSLLEQNQLAYRQSELRVKAILDKISEQEQKILELQKENFDLTMQVQTAKADQEQLKIVMRENSQLRRDKERVITSAQKIEKQRDQLHAENQRLRAQIHEKDSLIGDISRDNELLLERMGSDLSGSDLTDEDAVIDSTQLSPEESPPKTLPRPVLSNPSVRRRLNVDDTQSPDSSLSGSDSPSNSSSGLSVDKGVKVLSPVARKQTSILGSKNGFIPQPGFPGFASGSSAAGCKAEYGRGSLNYDPSAIPSVGVK